MSTSEYNRAVWKTIGLFTLFSIGLSILGSLLGASTDGPNVAGVVLLLIGFVSLFVFVRALFRIDKRYSGESR